jgi:hypothetical protein
MQAGQNGVIGRGQVWRMVVRARALKNELSYK